MKVDRFEAVRAANVALYGFPTGTRVRIVGPGHRRGRTGVVSRVPCLPGMDYRYVALERTPRERTDHNELFACSALEVLPCHS